MPSLDRKLLRDLVSLWGQILAIVLIVACGIASLVTMMSTYESLTLSMDAYYSQYRFADVFVQVRRAPNAVVSQIEAIPGVGQVRSRVVVDVTLDVPGLADPASGRLVSIPEEPQTMLNDVVLRAGRYIEPGRRDEVLVSEAFAAANRLKLGDTVGAVINGRWELLRLVGTALSPEYVYEISGTELLPDNQRFGVMWIGREALANAFDLDGAFNDLALSLTPGASEAEVIFRLDQILERFGGLGAYGRNEQLSHRFLSDDIAALQVTALILPVIFLGIAAFLLNLVLARLVSTQRDQIAVLKAFGYTNGEVGLHFFKLVLVVVLLGAAVGIGLGRWLGGGLTQFYTQFYQFPVIEYRASLGLILGAVGVSAIAAFVGALNAVWGVVVLPPAEAIRPEPPASFQPTLVERLGLQRFFSPAGRIILRNLERRPWQAALSIFGISLAVAILIVGRYQNDGIQQIMAIQFRTIQREDLTLVFNEPRSGRVQYDLAHLPGVLYVEPFRAVPARLRFEHRTRLSGVTGLVPNSQLRQLLDRHLQKVPLPPGGVVLSTKLADLLGVEVGDVLTLEILEGGRPIREVPMVGRVDELLGLTAYMDVQALNALLQEGSAFSGAYLSVDAQQLPELYKTLKQTPAIASVSQRETALRQFQNTIATTSGVFNGVLLVFACIISVGVVYNSARIALSERSRELATLRIIGFTQAEIAFILLGEQGLLTLTAVPVGWGLGYALSQWLNQSPAHNTEMFRVPFVIQPSSYLFTLVVIAIAALLSGGLLARQLQHLDLIAVLKTRE
ncbi:FtsX-like permease family protein [Synechococcales cyanobacterium C]|uniref:FtsX-like permease family protein n=1 Tax=Petrachloros mirabilis ULC683 TaxID=2781853 RepID=A0A8K1ZY14_9CYAN|nr:FtsX-like permease family protein [Petrachloros mirabilis]NCJ05927.1 FtsX-like permease family protein [Petrachloros mirabilis ULC683]